MLTRRTFLKSAAATTALKHLPAAAQAEPAVPWPENGTLLPDTGWHLLLDPEAEWQQDTLHLPGEFNLKDLPTNPPTQGWPILETCHKSGCPTARPEPVEGSGLSDGGSPQGQYGPTPITLPSTVEEHFWGAQIPGVQDRPYTPEEYRYAADDPIPQNGAYFGVSWWFTPLAIPASHKGKRLFLHIRAARLRAEVYLNRKLVGYSIMEELPFECDITDAANPGGTNTLAIRITNPFGRFDWVDGLNAQWGAVKLYRSHGFGGLDRGITLSAHEGTARFTDLWVLNTTESEEIEVNFNLQQLLLPGHQFRYQLDKASTGPLPDQEAGFEGTVHYEVIEVSTNKTLVSGGIGLGIDHGINVTPSDMRGKAQNMRRLRLPNPKVWTVETPHLYYLRATFTSDRGAGTDTRTIPFAFRTFAPANIASPVKPAYFQLNGRRIKLYSSISWGYWGHNGLFPTPELAEKEVLQAKRLNLNTLNFHRNLAKEDVLRAGDRLGLLRVLEPGAGKFAIGKLPPATAANSANIVMQKPIDEADKFAQRYMFAKCVAMVRAFRSHPSVIQYTLQNEIGADFSNPDTLAILAAMRAEDPSRSIVLNDGFVAPSRRAAQAWYEPWNDQLHRSDDPKEPFADYWIQHQGAGDQWYDEFYKSPADFTYRAPDLPGTLTEFGEMEGCAVPDNHTLMLHQLGTSTSYDKRDHEEIESATSAFLARWGFRQAFPTNETLWLSLGKKSYDSWQNYLENARISDALDFSVISGWESTAIENHSGIVDNLRNFKSDPTPIAATLQPIRPIAKQRSLCVATGQPATFDLYLCNDTGIPAIGVLTFTAVTPSNKLLKLITLPVPHQLPETFSYLLREAFQTPPLTEEGMYRFRFTLSTSPQSTQLKELWVTAPPELESTRPTQKFDHGYMGETVSSSRFYSIAVAGISPALREQLRTLPGYLFVDFDPTQHFAAIITSGLTTATQTTQTSGDTTGLEAQPAAKSTHKPEPGESPTGTQLGHIDPAVLAAAQAGTPLLVIPQTDALAEGCAQQLAALGAFTYAGTVGDFRAPWMGNWYFVRRHPLYEGLPVDEALGIHYQAPGRQSDGLLVDGPNVEIVAAYSRDHDRKLGAGTFTTRLGRTKVIFHRIPDFHPVLQQRFLANALRYLTT